MGGPEATEKVQWMVGVIEQFFQENDDLQPEEVEDYIAEILDNEFDTVVEDGSLIEISRKFCSYFRLCQSGCEAEVLTAISKIPVAHRSPNVTHQASDAESSSSRLQPNSEEQELSEQLQSISLNPSSSNSSPEAKKIDADEWTVVHRGKRR